jgi:hypothetical protein
MLFLKTKRDGKMYFTADHVFILVVYLDMYYELAYHIEVIF